MLIELEIFRILFYLMRLIEKAICKLIHKRHKDLYIKHYDCVSIEFKNTFIDDRFMLNKVKNYSFSILDPFLKIKGLVKKFISIK